MTGQHVLDFDAVLEVLNSAIRRADIFMGVGLNAAEQKPPISHVLSHSGPGVQLVKEELSPEEQEHVALEFAKWVRANGLRELLETFSIFLLKIYEFAFLISCSKGAANLRPPPVFERKGIGDQIEIMSKILPLPDDHLSTIKSLNQARNCYAHRRGVVGHQDIDENTGQFEVSWLRLRYELEEPDGNVVPEEELFGRFVEKGGKVRLRVDIDRRSFWVGQELVLAKEDLKHICLCIHIIGHAIASEALKYAKEAGAKFVPPKAEAEAKTISSDEPV